ncbi:unnamed protein product [Vitrella brassicaformis CCMP3155]|uniref:Uncharacterized protein n=1 Tax=Vitrella brassicaformis (strain CCMP3155) TaxID=1169540 RepID=A0A0G4EHG6_VITBC|nr:unnamed protein product [Vitrella brassicaformis CCMP3155]|mmetsp:Transcript_11142/g.26935  ORF Transcript_11142/g.26935 Transcript_11142/m.26935 type:complete len:200 (-) Transcript_11142:1639-2238(-)|eukprot:CEL95465.1 unnamed protein product [Vitrella brassicaformis CCMP3155]
MMFLLAVAPCCCCSGRQGCRIVTAIFTVVWLVAGLALLSTGAIKKIKADSLNPAADFEALGRVCTIDDIGAKQYQITGSEERDRCEEEYKYFFTVGNGTRIYTSRIEKQSRPGPCPVGFLDLQTYAVGQTVDCWRARKEVSSVYQCGNKPECYKIFDPAAEAKEWAKTGVTLMIIGGAFIGVAVLLAGIHLLCIRVCRQ